MSIRYRILILIAIALVALTGMLAMVTRHVVTRAFANLENDDIGRTLSRMDTSLDAEHAQLARLTDDWAHWDDLYEFATGARADFVEINLKNEDIAAIDLQFLLIVNRGGEPLYGCLFDAATGERQPVPESAASLLPPGHRFFAPETPDDLRGGCVRIDDTLYLLKARLIKPSARTGDPAGTLIFGRRIDHRIVAALSNMLQHPVDIHLNGPLLREHAAVPHPAFGHQVHLIGDTAYVHNVIRGLDDEDIATFCARVPRAIHHEMIRTRRLIYATVLLTVLALGAGVLGLLERTVLRPLSRVMRAILQLHEPLPGRARIPVDGQGEMRQLSEAINQLLASVEHHQTQRQQALHDLSAEKENLATTITSIADGVITTDREGRVVFMNPSAERLTGWGQTRAQGQPLTVVLPLINERTGKPEEDLTHLVAVEGDTVTREHDVLLAVRDDLHHPVSDSCAPIRDSQGGISGFVIVFRETAAMRKAAREDVLAEKLEAIGVLAGGIAHDFNNLLTAILSSISIARKPETPRDVAADFLQAAEESIQRAGRLTKQLLTFASGGEPVQAAVDLPTLIRHTAELLCRERGGACRYHFAPDLNTGWVDVGQVEQAFHNIILNAIEATPDGGEIMIQAVNVDVSDPGAPASAQNSLMVRVDIIDVGIGMSADIQHRIFEPYFTTKQRAGGLGLASAHSIITRHGGAIRVQSAPGQGTRVMVYLPAIPEEDAQAVAPSNELVSGKGRILFMDDEEILQNLNKAILESAGYQVQTAGDGATAVHIYKKAMESGQAFDLIILDLMVQGGMGGLEAFRRIREIDPGVIAMVSSGYSNDPVMANHTTYGFRSVMPKPYSTAAMTTEVNKLISAGRKPAQSTAIAT